MFHFLIPLTGRTPRVDWEKVCRLLGGTLRSILNQTDPDFRVLISGQDRPVIAELSDPRVTFLTTDLSHPPDVEAERGDKNAKVRLLLRAALAAGAEAIARMDADDRVNRRLVQHYREHPHPTGFLCQRGYVWDYAAGRIAPSEIALKAPFHMRCGSCSIIALKEIRRDLGDDIEALEAYVTGLGKHAEYAARAAKRGRPFDEIPFRGAVYVINHGVGLAYRRGWESAARERRHERIRRHRINVTPEMRLDFCLEGAFEPAPERVMIGARLENFAARLLWG